MAVHSSYDLYMTRAILMLAAAVSAQGAGWIALEPVIVPRQEVAVAAANGKLYLIGGLSGEAVLSSVEEYDPTSGRWRFVAPLSSPIHHAAAATIGNSIYVIGGEGNPASVTGVFPQTESYDIESRTWRSEPLMAVPRHGIGAATIGKLIHIPAGAPIQGFSTTAEHDAFFTDGTRRRAVR
jgi:hypothetical protein